MTRPRTMRRRREQAEGPAHAEVDHHHQQHGRGDGEIDQPGGHRAHRDHQPGKVNLADQVLIAHHALARLGDRVREEHPGDQAGEDEQGIRHVARGAGRRLAKEEAEDQHRRQRLQDRPGRPQNRLLVTHLDVAPGQEEQELTVPPELPQIDELPAMPPLDDRLRQSAAASCGCGAAAASSSPTDP